MLGNEFVEETWVSEIRKVNKLQWFVQVIKFKDRLHGVDLHISDSSSFQQGFESIIKNTKLDDN